MIERVHEHIVSELHQSARTDTIFILTAIILNLMTLAINSIAAGANDSATTTAIMGIFVCLIIVVNIVAIFGLFKGKQTRAKLINGLLKMYKDQGVDGYYDESLLRNYDTRYNLFILTVVCTGLVAIIVPFVLLAANFA